MPHAPCRMVTAATRARFRSLRRARTTRRIPDQKRDRSAAVHSQPRTRERTERFTGRSRLMSKTTRSRPEKQACPVSCAHPELGYVVRHTRPSPIGARDIPGMDQQVNRYFARSTPKMRVRASCAGEGGKNFVVGIEHGSFPDMEVGRQHTPKAMRL